MYVWALRHASSSDITSAQLHFLVYTTFESCVILLNLVIFLLTMFIYNVQIREIDLYDGSRNRNDIIQKLVEEEVAR